MSWWKAIKDEVWHLEKGHSRQNEATFYEQHYDFDALSHLFKEAMLRECAIQAYFSAYGITPLTLVYEDFIQDFEGSIRRIMDYLDINTPNFSVAPFFYEKTASSGSEKWVQRFREELQGKMGHKIW